MIACATRGSGGKGLARHLLSRKDGQTVQVLPARGLAADNLKDQIDELVALSAHGRTDRPVHHLHIDPPPDAVNPEAVIEAFVRYYEKEFGLEEAPTCAVRHIKGGRVHEHRVWSLVDTTGRVVDLRHDHARREKICRVTEFECGLPLIKGAHNRAVAKVLRAEGREDVTAAMEAAGLLSGVRPIAHLTPRERAQAERTKVPLGEIRNRALAAWDSTQNSRELAVALHAFDFSIARGRAAL